MPNTFVHLGLQGFATKAVLRDADFRWIAVGCIIPDVPWIMQRAILAAGPRIDHYELLNYFAVQASLLFCLLLAGALALLAADSARVFVLLAANSLAHLMLDALQIKWGNGVHLLAPFSWQMTSINLVWPEHPFIYLLTGLGAAALLWFGAREWHRPLRLAARKTRLGTAAFLVLLYLAAPFLLSDQLFEADSRYSSTLRDRDQRPGRYLELDRAPYREDDRTVRIFNGERLQLVGAAPDGDGLVSIRGFFTDTDSIHVSELHVHSPMRDIFSIIALAGVLALWTASMMRRQVNFRRKP